VEVWVTDNQATQTPRDATDSSAGEGRAGTAEVAPHQRHANRSDIGSRNITLPNSRAGDRIAAESKPVDLVALKFPGTAGRAERGGPHPFELFPATRIEIWTVNPPGYGGSHGSASLQHLATTLDALWDQVANRYPGVQVALIGNSLGCLSALYLSAREKVAGMYLRNPVPVKQLIRGRLRYNWWNLGLAGWLANQIPSELDGVANARLSEAPLLMVSSGRDRVCPVHFQQMILDSYHGAKSQFVLKDAGHHDRVPLPQVEEYTLVTTEFIQRMLALR
jgi:pimeloyl-ACP methyl ester carboxylesterase